MPRNPAAARHYNPVVRALPLLPLFLSFVVLAAACASRSSTGEGNALRTLLADDWQYWMTQYPELATAIGYPGQNGRWTDYSQPAIDARAQHLRQSRDRLAAINRAHLSADDQLDYDLYRDLVESAVQGLEFHNDAVPIRSVVVRNLLMPINQIEGVPQDVPLTFSLMPAVTLEDYENFVRRLEGAPALIDHTIALMEQGLARGMTPPRITLRDVPDQLKAQLVSDPLTSPLLAAFTRWPAAIGGPDRARLTKAASDAFRGKVAPAFSRLHEFLISRYLPACRETTGIDALPNGAAMYLFNVRWHTTTPRTPQEIHEIGLAEVKRIRAEMETIITKVGFKGTFADFTAFLRTSPQFYFKDAPSLLTAYRDITKRADPELAHLFGRLPQTPYGVVPVPDAIAPSQTTAYYQPGSLAAGRPANMFANTYKLDARPKWEMEALTLHEAVPGHHVQVALAQELASLAEFRKNSSYTAFVEGWALYAESLGDEMGFYKDPYSKFGQLTYDMWRAVRLVVDTGLHSMGWTRQQAIDFFLANSAKTEQDIVVEVDRYIVWPGQALGYKMGQLKIRELRTNAERALGPRFNVRTFHDTVLGQGAVPLDVLETRVRAWVGTTTKTS
ncbi:MAG TPA: DUF885 domain-containing protein [Vicinamibacterales bacterium]|nr:DUF885 domain-containing protein [Vicinamibacterales bacterium]